MKAEERHRLEQNALAAWLAGVIKAVEPYSKTILLGLVIAALALAVRSWWGRTSARGTAQAWDGFHAAWAHRNVVELDDLAEQNAGRRVGEWAALEAGNLRLLQGSHQLFFDRANAAQELRKAVESFGLVIERSREPELREQALFGRARAYECLAGTRQSEGELDKAIADYERLVEAYPKGPFAELAGRRLEELKSKETKVFYDKFAAYNPRPPSRGGAGGTGLPFDMGSLPDDLPDPEFSRVFNLGAPSKKEEGKTEPGKTEPGKGLKVESEPPHTEPGKPAPGKTEAAKPLKLEAASPKTPPAKAKTENPKSEPPPKAPAKAEPAKAEPPKK